MTKQRIALGRMGTSHSSGVTNHNNSHIKAISSLTQPINNNPFQINGYSSTRSYKFCEDEKVLCYEPDPTKAKVLYDAKVLKVVVTKDARGRNVIEYLIHFQGWNSSWDRCVAEEFVLKDTEENRQLQNDLNEKANALKQTLKKGKRARIVKGSRNTAAINPISDHGDDSGKSSSSEGESSDPESSDDEGGKKEEVQICIPDELKIKLEEDYMAIKDGKWVRLPTETTVVEILEDYVKYFGFSELKAFTERQKKKQASTSSVPIASTSSTCVNSGAAAGGGEGGSKGAVPVDTENDELDRVFRKISLLKEIMEGVRIMFDFLVERILMYPEEQEQVTVGIPDPGVANVDGHQLTWSFPNLMGSDEEGLGQPPAKRKKKSNSADAAFGATNTKFFGLDKDVEIKEEPYSPCSRRTFVRSSVNIETSDVKLMQYLDNLNDWKLIPLNLYMTLKCPSIVYGSVHLLRLFVKMPEVLSQSIIPRRRMKIIVKHMNLFLEYLATQNYLFDEGLFATRSRIQNELLDSELDSLIFRTGNFFDCKPLLDNLIEHPKEEPMDNSYDEIDEN